MCESKQARVVEVGRDDRACGASRISDKLRVGARCKPTSAAWTVSCPWLVSHRACRREISPNKLKCLVLGKKGGVAQCFANVFGLKVGIVAQDVFARFTSRKQTQQSSNRKPKTADAGLAGANGRINRDAFKSHGRKIADEAAVIQLQATTSAASVPRTTCEPGRRRPTSSHFCPDDGGSLAPRFPRGRNRANLQRA